MSLIHFQTIRSGRVEQRSEHPPVTVYLGARVYDATRSHRDRKGRRVGGGMRHCWSMRLERWTAEEVERHIVALFTRLADEEMAAAKERADGLRQQTRNDQR